MDNKFVAIIDFSNTFHKAYHVVRYSYKKLGKELDLTVEDDFAMVVRKVISNVYSVCKATYAQQVIVCFDSGTFRKELYPEYKAQRKEKPPMFDECLEVCYNLYKDKVGTLRVKNLESDDLMILAAESDALEKNWKILVTADEDARASLKRNVFAFDPTYGRKTTFSSYPLRADLLIDVSHKVIDPDYVLFLKIAKGCESDNISRIVPIRTRKTKIIKAYDYWKENGTKEGFYAKSLVEAFAHAELEVDEERAALQIRLVDLRPQFLPEGKYQEWKYQMNDLIESSYEDFVISRILKNTTYYDPNYREYNN